MEGRGDSAADIGVVLPSAAAPCRLEEDEEKGALSAVLMFERPMMREAMSDS